MREFRLFFFFSLIALTVYLAGCGVSEKTLNDAQVRIEALQEKGMPDSSLSSARVLLYQARDARERGNRGLAVASTDSMLLLIAQAEEQYTQTMERLKPRIDSLRSVLEEEREGFSGLHRQRFDSTLAAIDSLMAINWLIQAEQTAEDLQERIPRLKSDEKRAREIAPKIRGRWVYSDVIKKESDKTINAVEKKIFTFGPSDSGTYLESKKGKTDQFLKQDWEFRSYGHYGLLGDTIHLFVDRFAIAREIFEELHKRGDKMVWEKKIGETYDSVITDGSQDRYITYQDLIADFKRK